MVSVMPGLMFRVYLFIGIFTALVTAAGAGNYGNTLPKTEQSLVLDQMQKNMRHDQNMSQTPDICHIGPNKRSVEGVQVQPYDPLTDQINMAQRQQKCMENKMKQEKEIQRKVDQVMREEMQKAKSQPPKPQCVTKLNRDQHSCFIDKVLNAFYKTPVWTIAIHNNVAQLYYKGALQLMIVYEKIKYNVAPKAKECLSFFPFTNIYAEENALGHVVKVTGTPADGKKKKGSECRPCSDFLKKTTEGKAKNCSNSCDSLTAFINSDNFKQKKTSSASSKAKAKPAKDE